MQVEGEKCGPAQVYIQGEKGRGFGFDKTMLKFLLLGTTLLASTQTFPGAIETQTMTKCGELET